MIASVCTRPAGPSDSEPWARYYMHIVMVDVPNVLNGTLAGDPRLLVSEPFRALHFVFGLFHPEIPALSGRAVIGSLTVLGFTEEAARGIVLRLRRGGFLESRRVGRMAIYSLTRSVGLIDQVARRSSEPPPPWDSAFEILIVRIPPAQRAFREQLRRQATYAGFGSPVPGLLIAPYPASLRALAPLLEERPVDVTVMRGQMAMDAADAAQLATSAWDLGDISAALRRATGGMEAALRAAQMRVPDGAEALRLLWRGIGPFFKVLSERPPLPSELLPTDWPLAAAHQAFVELAATLAPRALRYVEVVDADGLAPDRTGPTRTADESAR
jgi:phenylacetic acid degradation operon negative regulatory protein